MPTRATVVLTPSGPVARDTLRSLDRQSLPAADFDVVIVPGAATPRDLEQMRNLSENRPNVHLRPAVTSDGRGARRNAGAAAAAGEYLLFLDEGTVLGEHALERLCTYADEQGADICLGRTTHRGRRPGTATIFAANLPRTPKDLTLLAALDAGKIYRRSFLASSGLRFPDDTAGAGAVEFGFDLQAVSKTDAVAVLSDYPAFATTAEATLASAAARLDGVAASAVPEELRQRALLAAHLSNLDLAIGATRKGLGIHGAQGLADYRDALNRNVPASVDEQLALGHLAVSSALRAGDLDELASTVRRLNPRPQVTKVSAKWSAGVLKLAFDVGFPAAGHPGAADGPHGPALGLCVYRSDESDEWVVPADDLAIAHDPESGVLHVTAHLRPAGLAGGDPLPPGIWMPALLVTEGGVGRRVRVPFPKRAPAASYAAGRATVSFSEAGKLTLDVGATSRPVVARLDPTRASVSEDAHGTLLRVELPQLDLAAGSEQRGRLRLGKLPVLATITRADEGPPVLEAFVSGLPGSYRLATKFSTTDYAPTGLALHIDGVGAMTTRPANPKAAANGKKTAAPRTGRRKPAPDPRGAARLFKRAVRRIPGTQAAYRKVRTGIRRQGA